MNSSGQSAVTRMHAFDRDGALSFVRDDVDFLRDLVETFGDYYPTMLDRISNALAAEDSAAIREAAHQLKGAMGNFHARAAASTALTLEQKGQAGDLVAAAELHVNLTEQLRELQEALNELVKECDGA